MEPKAHIKKSIDESQLLPHEKEALLVALTEGDLEETYLVDLAALLEAHPWMVSTLFMTLAAKSLAIENENSDALMRILEFERNLVASIE